MRLGEILTRLSDANSEFEIKSDELLALDKIVTGIENDSRKVKSGFIFVAVKGYESDGHQYIESALSKGACCVIVEETEYQNSLSLLKRTECFIPVIPFQNTRRALALLSKYFYDNPSQKLKLIGVTGTNGKTTITYMLKDILNTAGKKVGLLGTICNLINDKKIKSPVTTPDSLELNRLFNEMLSEGVEYVLMEVSSHALYLDRVYGLDFDVIIFTNLSEDHLDFHKNMEDYLSSKLKILDILANSQKEKTMAVINHDIESGQRFIKRAEELNLNYHTYGLTEEAHVQAFDMAFTLSNSTFTIKQNGCEAVTTLPIPGKFNIYNAMAAFGAVRFFDIPIESVQKGFNSVSVPGRFQLIPSPNGAYIVIDYAHTDDAIENVLATLRELNPKRITSVFGCGGDRDKGKRSLMGKVSARMSDLTIVTSDNPRTESPNRILDDIVSGVNEAKGKYIKIENRYTAIQKAIELSEEGDLVLVAGKGHEDYQILKDKTIHFDDKEAVDNILRGLYGKALN